jgi:cytoskeletal protein RodZ
VKKAGEIIKSARVEQKLSIHDVIKGTKIPEEYILAIEKDQFPDGVYAQLYVKKYAEFLNLSPETMAAIFRRDYEESEETSRFSFQKLNFFSKWQGYIAAGVLVMIFLGYLFYQYLNFVRPPIVKIREINLTSQGWVVSGKTHPQASLKIDDQIVNLDDRGRFTYTASRDDQEIQIIVQSPAGRTRTVTKKLE